MSVNKHRMLYFGKFKLSMCSTLVMLIMMLCDASVISVGTI